MKVMRIATDTIERAFRARHDRYTKDKDWPEREFAGLWLQGQQAFGDAGERKAFHDLYSRLRGAWLVFRPLPAKDIPSAEQVYSILAKLDRRLRTLRLTELTPDDARNLWTLLCTAGQIKRAGSGAPSLMAVSKFLHFWNPRLFVIVDDAAMGGFVLAHTWLYRSIEQYGASIARSYPSDVQASQHFRARGLRYLDILFWAGELLRNNPAIMDVFSAHVREHLEGEAFPPGWEHFEAAAVEWLLLGLVELPPAGVEVG